MHFFENPCDLPYKETYSFKTTRNAPRPKSLANFENDFTHLLANLEYTDERTPFQRRLARDIKIIQNSPKVYVSADKTSNLYLMDKEDYKKLMRDSVTAHYEKTDEGTMHNINLEAKFITESLDISDRVEPIAPKNAYITIKDHKEDFPNNVKTRLINPAKTNIGLISQKLLQDINGQIRKELGLQQWRSTSDTLNWFKNLKFKTRLKFLQLDIVDFYPSITEELFNAALLFASETVTISQETKDILHHARQSLLFHNDAVWKKTTGLFDVTMGSYDGCELCELVGLYILQKMRNKFPEIDFGLYRDDGLGALKRTPKTKLEKLKKDIFKMFKEELGLKITLDTDLTTVNFLDVTFDLHAEKYCPYRKPNDVPVYIHKDSNHPPHVSKQLPISIQKRLNEISSEKESFDSFKTDYEEALSKSGLQSKLAYQPPQTPSETPQHKKQRKRNVIWFTPPYSAALKTNLGKEFLKLIDKHFPVNNPLHKIINRKSVKLSYSCTPNMNAIIASHNRKVITETKPEAQARCNCDVKELCPVPGECCRRNVVYHATVHHDDGKTAQYIGCTEPKFKDRYGNHKKSFRHDRYKSETALSGYVWQNNLNPTPVIRWKFLKNCTTYNLGDKACDLCLSEKFLIVKNFRLPDLINKRTDVGNKCIHKRTRTLKYYP